MSLTPEYLQTLGTLITALIDENPGARSSTLDNLFRDRHASLSDEKWDERIDDNTRWLEHQIKRALVKRTAAATVTQDEAKSEGSAFLDRALPMIQRNIPVIRLQPKSKIPMNKAWQEIATTDEATIREWAKETPNANCACVAKHDGVLFFETDEPGVIERFEKETGEKLPQTFTAQSREGRYHFYWLQTDESRKCGSITQKEIPFGSLRQNNAYVVSPGSIHPTTGLPYAVVDDSPVIPIPTSLIAWLVAQKLKAAPKATTASSLPVLSPEDLEARIQEVISGDPIPRGSHDVTLTEIAGTLRGLGLEQDRIEELLIQTCEARCVGVGSDWVEMCKKIAKSVCRYPAGNPGPTVLIGGKVPGATPATTAPAAQPELVIDSSEACARPVFPYHVMEGTSLFEGLVKPTIENSSKHAEFVFVPGVQLMLNCLNHKARIRMQDVNLNMFVGLISPPGQFFKSSSCGLAQDYFKAAGLCAKHTKSMPGADGRVIVGNAGSSEGFGLAMTAINARHAILFNDELGKLAGKAGIENSSLPHDLLTWFESGEYGNTIKSQKESFSFEAGTYTFGWQWCTTDRGFNRHWPKLAGAVSGLEDRMFFVVGPEEPRKVGLYKMVPFEEDAAKKTAAIIEAAVFKGIYDFASIEDAQKVVADMEDPRAMQMLLAFALYFAVDLQRESIDSDCLMRARQLVNYRNQATKFLAPIEADNEQGRLQQEITRELRQNRGKMKYRDLCRALHADRSGTDRWNAGYWGLVKAGITADFQEKLKSGQMCRMTALLLQDD